MIVITGGTGRIGSAIADQLKQEIDEDELCILTRGHFQTGEFRQIVAKADVVIHAAGSVKFWDPNDLYQGNVVLTKNLVDNLDLNTLFIHLSSISVYGSLEGVIDERSPTKPTTPYGKTKLEAERIVLSSCKRAVVLRLGPVYGPRFEDYARVIRLVKRVGKIIIGPGTNHIPFVHVGDVASLVSTIVRSNKSVSPSVFNVCGHAHTQKEIIDIVVDILKEQDPSWRPKLNVHVPVPVAQLIGKLGDVAKAHRLRAPITSEHVKIMSMDRDVRSDLTISTFKWASRPLRKGIEEYISSSTTHQG